MQLNEKCPECGGELDTGYECNDCGFDATKLYSPERTLGVPEFQTALATCEAARRLEYFAEQEARRRSRLTNI